jgi:hypothetical protein
MEKEDQEIGYLQKEFEKLINITLRLEEELKEVVMKS